MVEVVVVLLLVVKDRVPRQPETDEEGRSRGTEIECPVFGDKVSEDQR